MTALHTWSRTIALASSLFLAGAHALANPQFMPVSKRISGGAGASAAGGAGGGSSTYEFTNKNSWGVGNPAIFYTSPSSYARANAFSSVYSSGSNITVTASESTTASANSRTGFNGSALAQAVSTASATFQVTESGLYLYSYRVRSSRSGFSFFGVASASASGASRGSSVINVVSGSSEESDSGTVQLFAGTTYTVSASTNANPPQSFGPAGTQSAATVNSDCYATFTISVPPGPGSACSTVDYNSDTALNLDDLSDFITDFYMAPPIPGGNQPDAPVYPDVNFPATPCPNAPDAPAPYATDAYRVYGYRVGFSADGSTTCPFSPDQNFPSLENLADFITSYYALFTGGGC